MSDSIKVAIKVRPLIKREKEENLSVQWFVRENMIISADQETRKRGDSRYLFDHIFDTDASNSDVFNTIIKPIIDAAVHGFNGTVFAYGQTSSGKTYTMMGTQDQPGIIPLSIDYVFDAIHNCQGREFLLRVSYVEIYNERINDLLDNNGLDLKLHEDASGQVIVHGKEEITNSSENVLAIMQKGDKNRRVGKTNMNEYSSRSHTIFRITIESRNVASDSDGAIQVSQLNLVDLAGSERAILTGATGERAKEGRHINLSLSTLGLVIKQLSESVDSQKHVNFRDSKLTRLLQNSLGGNAMTVMICAVTPASADETQCTLSFASRAKSIKNKPKLNEVMSDATLLKRYAKQIAKLNAELGKIKSEGNSFAKVEEMESKLLEKDRINQLLEERIELLQTKIVSGSNIINQEESFQCQAARRRTWGGPGTFMIKTDLPTIKEVSPEKGRGRKSIIRQSMHMMNQTFQTAFEDFELELIESERDRMQNDSTDDSETEAPEPLMYVTGKRKQRVQFVDNVDIKIEPDSCNLVQQKSDMSTQTSNELDSSPSTPKQILRSSFHRLNNEFRELREYTKLEKQILIQQTKLNDIPDAKEIIESLGFKEDDTIVHIMTVLCNKLRKAEEELANNQNASRKLLDQQVRNMTSERNDFEYICKELRTELNKKTADLELKIMNKEEENRELLEQIKNLSTDEIRELRLRDQAEFSEKISELTRQVENITSVRDEFQRENLELHGQLYNKTAELELKIIAKEDENRELQEQINKISPQNEEIREFYLRNQAELNEKISELARQVENITSERDEFQHENLELHSQLYNKTAELESKIIAKENENRELQEQINKISPQNEEIREFYLRNQAELNEKISELARQVENITSERNEFQHISLELRAELEKKILEEWESQRAIEPLMEKISTLEQKIERITSERNMFENVKIEMSGKLESTQERICKLESDIIMEKAGIEEAKSTIASLEKLVGQVTSRKSELESVNRELQNQASESESRINAETTANRESMETISKLQKEIESLSCERNQFEQANGTLRTELNRKTFELGLKKTSEEEMLEKISELVKQIESATEKNLFDNFKPNLRNNLKTTNQISEPESSGETEEAIEIEDQGKEMDESACCESEEKLLEEASSEEHPMSMTKFSELQKQIGTLISEKNQFEQQSTELKKKILDLESRSDFNPSNECVGSLEESGEFSFHLAECNESNGDLSMVIVNVEETNAKLSEEVSIKTSELQEFKNNVQDLKSDIEKFQATISLLTTENQEMSDKLSIERARSKEAQENSQKIIDELRASIFKVTSDKTILERDLVLLTERLDTIDSKKSDAINEEEIKEEAIRKLTRENIELSMTLVERTKELENIKESKSLLYDHECKYKELLSSVNEKITSLELENNELSTDLMDKIEENDAMKEECEALKNKLELISVKSIEATEKNVSQLLLENKLLQAEVIELKTRVVALSEENIKFSEKFLQDADDPNAPTKEKEVDSAEVETLKNNVNLLQEKVEDLTRCNTKLSDLKFSSCEYCEHLLKLKDSHRQLKLEKKTMHRKLEDLQKKFDRKCADTELLKARVNQDLNLSQFDASLNSSCVDGLNMSYVEEKVQHLNCVLQTLTIDYDKLSIQYQEKCDEVEKLQDAGLQRSTPRDLQSGSLDSKVKKVQASRIQQVIKSLDRVREDIDALKATSMNITGTLDRFKIEKMNLLEEIDALKNINDDLVQKLSDKEMIVAAADEKAQILECELINMNREIQQYAVREKASKSEKLTLEVELENLKAQKVKQNIQIDGLHQTIDELNERLFSLRKELDSMVDQKDELSTSMIATVDRYKEEIKLLDNRQEELENQTKLSLEREKLALSRAKELEINYEKLQVNLAKQETLQNEFDEKVTQWEGVLQENMRGLKQKLETLSAVLSDNETSTQVEYKEAVNSMSRKVEEFSKASDLKLQGVNEILQRYCDENDYLSRELDDLRGVEDKLAKAMDENECILNEKRILVDGNKKLEEELNAVRSAMAKELKSLGHKTQSTDWSDKSVNEIFLIFMQTLLSKEQEVMKTMQQRFEKDKQLLEEKNRQFADTEKRNLIWARELEADIEKLQVDLTKKESMLFSQTEEISQLKHSLKESTHEAEMLREKLDTLEAEFTVLQTEFEKQRRTDNKQDEEIFLVQQREKEAQAALKSKENELQTALNFETAMYEKRIEELVSTIDSFKAEKDELENNIEELENNEKQLRNIIEANLTEKKKSEQQLDELSIEIEQLTEDHNNAKKQLEERTTHIEKITELLKSKCDMLSEYKTKLGAILPDYEQLQSQIRERKKNIELCKEEIERLKMEKEEAIRGIKDQLNSEEIKNAGLNKQLNELHNKNMCLMEDLDKQNKRCHELERENEKLERKIRNSTSKIKAQEKIDELKDNNDRLQNNLEGASNRIAELQETKSQLLNELALLKGEYDLMCQEYNEIRKTLSLCKTQQIDDKYDALLQEKNRVALELEGKKILFNQQERELEKYKTRVEELTVKNKEFDEELEDYAKIIRDLEAHNGKLDDQLHSKLTENKIITDLEEQVKVLNKENESLQCQLKVMSHELSNMMESKLHDRASATELKVLSASKKENMELQARVLELDNKQELKSNSSSSRSSSPCADTTRRRRSRNKFFNLRRQLEDVSDEEADDSNKNINCGDCEILRNQIIQLERELALRKAKIVTLDMQIEAENFPFKEKCKSLEEQLVAYSRKNTELSAEVRKLGKALHDVNTWECDICRNWRVNRRDQTCQTIPEKAIGFRSMNSGIVDDFIRMSKLEKKYEMVKKSCRSHLQVINELKKELEKHENNQSTSVLVEIGAPQEKSSQSCSSISLSDKKYDVQRISKPTTKENVPVNFLHSGKPNYTARYMWSNNP